VQDPVVPARDLFDAPTSGREATTPHIGAISPIALTVSDSEEGYLALRWRSAGIALVLAGGLASLAHLPHWAIAVMAFFSAGMSLWALPRWVTAPWRIAVASFFFAQITSIFDVPFTWPMRFAFAAVLLGGIVLSRVGAGD
jgi:hypothetical protein